MTVANVSRRLRPLYFASFFERFVLWYAIEKAFMKSIGFDDASIGIALATMLCISIALEVPSGILADRWSRKGTLLVANACLFTMTLLSSQSNSVISYAVAISFWGAYFAMQSGVRSSIVYDVLLEEGVSTDHYEKVYGRFEILSGAGMAAGSISSGIVVHVFELRAAYLFTLVFVGLAIVALLLFEEPLLHKTGQEGSLFLHTKQTFKEVLGQPSLYLLLLLIVFVLIISRLFFELVQLWWIPLGISLSLFGPLSSVIFSAPSLAGFLAHKVRDRKLIIIALPIFAASFLLSIKNPYLVVPTQLVVLTFSLLVAIVLQKKLNDAVSSQVRAGAGSVIGLISNLTALFFVAFFGYVSDRAGVFAASAIVNGLLLFVVIGLTKEFLQSRKPIE